MISVVVFEMFGSWVSSFCLEGGSFFKLSRC
jgi:hypothetical protein